MRKETNTKMKRLACFWVLFTLVTNCMCEDIDYLSLLDICHQQCHSCESGPNNLFCSCDSMCLYRDNCCYDASVITEGRRELTYIQRQYLQMTTCVVTSFKEDDILTQGAFMISSCPVAWNGDIDTRKRCEMSSETDIRDMLPVVDITTNITFKNRQCANCNNVQTYIPWLLKTSCSAEGNVPSLSIVKDVMTKVNSDQCSYRFIPPKDVTEHNCYLEFNYTIISDVSGLDDNSTCGNRVFSPVYVDLDSKNMSFFRNLQCLIAAKGPRYQDDLKFSYCICTTSKYFGTLKTVLSSLIDFSLVIQRRTTMCKDEEIHLSDETGCQRLYCPVRSEPSAGKCVDVRYTSDGVVLDLLFQVHPYPLSERRMYFLFHQIIQSFFTAVRKQTGLALNTNWAFLRSETPFTQGILTNSTGKCYIIDIYTVLEATAGHTLESERLWTTNYFSNYTFINTDGSIVTHISNTEDISCQTNVSFHNPLFLKEMISVDNDLPCPAVKLQHSGNESEIEGNIANKSSLLFNLNGIHFSPSDVVFANGDNFVCVDTFLSKYHATFQIYDVFDRYRSYTNTACASISILCMLYCLVQYCVIPIFRDGKSDLLVVLLLFLLLAQTCFLFLSNFAVREKVCDWVGTFHHFTWLCAFSFMFLGPYRLNSEIRDLQTYSKTERLVITIKYMLVGISLPSFVVICIKVVNLILAPTEKWYVGRLCFISQPYIVLFGFVVPILLILCGNVVLFICIIRYITSTCKSANSNKSNLLVFIKISTIMGFSWIIGIVGILSESDAVLLVFEVLSNLQGALITISFSCNNRVWTFYRDWFQRLKNNSRTESVPM